MPLSTTNKSPMAYSILGALNFALVSLLVFSTVAFAESWMYKTLGLYGAYLAWTLLFILLGGGALYVLVKETLRPFKFFALFSGAFLLYAVGWVAAYFILRDGVGEWVASLAGSILMALVFAVGFRKPGLTFIFSAILFIANSVGYFLGLFLNASIKGKAGMLLWGAAYGLFLGAGLGLIFNRAQYASQSTSTNPQPLPQ